MSLVEPCFAPVLFTREAVSRLREVVPDLVSIPPYRIGFECRLAPGDDQVDLQQGFTGHGGTQVRLARYLEDLVEAGELGSPAWLRIQSFCTEWANPSSLLHAQVVDFWLEFDLPVGGGKGSVPAVFFGLEPKTSSAGQGLPVALAALEMLQDAPVAPPLAEGLQRCFAACPAGVWVSHIGLMLSRNTKFLRVNLKGVRGEDVLPLLEALRWPGEREALRDRLARCCAEAEAFTVCLDLGPAGLAPRLGLECFQTLDTHRPARWAAFFRALVAEGLCDPAKAEALQAWPGTLDPSLAAAPWPPLLVLKTLVAPPDHFGVFSRELTHVKLTCQPGRAPEAKAYFGFSHVWLKPELPPDSAAPAAAAMSDAPTASAVSPRSLQLPAWYASPSAKLSRDASAPNVERKTETNTAAAAMQAAMRYLLTTRTQTGWWQSFGGYQVGPSDEWVTAYVGAALASLPDERCRRAAAWGWTLLAERRPTDPGWGFNVVNVPDADSTLWALRLAQAVGAGASAGAAAAARVKRATEFLARHVRPSGALTTFEEAYYLAFEKLPRIPAGLQSWFEDHACVTAAAGGFAGIGKTYHSFLRAAQRADGSWTSYWWPDDEYTTALAAEALATSGEVEDRPRIERAATWVLTRLGPAGGVVTAAQPEGSAFATALCVRVLSLAPESTAAREALTRAVRWLLAAQQPDGAWAPSAVVLANKGVTPVALLHDDTAVFTTATVLTALANLPV